MTLDFQGSDSQDPPEPKDFQVSQVSPEPQEDQADREWTVSPDNLEFLAPRVNQDLDSLDLRVHLECLALKVSQDPREIRVSPVALDRPAVPDLTAVLELRVTLEPLASPEPVVHQDPPPLAHWDNQAAQELQA